MPPTYFSVARIRAISARAGVFRVGLAGVLAGVAALAEPGIAAAAGCGPVLASAPILAQRLVAALPSHLSGVLAFKPPFGPPQGDLDPGFADFLDGRRPAALLTREIAEPDLARFRRAHAGRAPVVMPVAAGAWNRFGYVDAVVVIVNRENPLRSLSLRDLDAMLSTTRWRGGGDVTRWGQLGLGGSWRLAPVHLTGGADWQDSESARALTIRRLVLSLPGRTGRWKRAADSGSEAEVVERVGKDRLAVGFTGAGHLSPAVRAVRIEGVAADEATAASGRYPLLRTVDLLFDAPAGRIDPRLARSLDWFLSPEGQGFLGRQGDFAALPAPTLRESRRKLARLSPARGCD